MIKSTLTRQALIAAAFATIAGGAEPGAAPVIPGLHQKHPLNERQTGELLIGELRCASCHEGMDRADMKLAPDLKGVGSRLNPGYLARFIANPSAVHPGTTMPSMLATEPEEKRKEISESISLYLRSLDRGSKPAEQTAKADPIAGRELFHEVGCVACHSPRDEAGNEIFKAGMVSLSHLSDKYRQQALAEFLFDPLKTHPSGRMPDMNLSKEEAASIASYLIGNKGEPVPEITPSSDKGVSEGMANFKTYNCTACHQPDDSTPPPPLGPPLGKLNPTSGCLADHSSTGANKSPDFHLSENQKKAIRAALSAHGETDSASDRTKMQLTRLDCIACHNRDDYGGVAADRDIYFHSTEEALGNESRIPPPLTMIGAKLQAGWLNKVLYDRESIRPYMRTRMPHFGDVALKGLPDLFSEVDRMDPVEMPVPDDNSRPMISNAGHLLLGDKGLGCIACHNYNGKESPGMKGLDLMTSNQRLQPAWFRQFLLKPANFRPGIIMPSFWPDGKAVQTDILNGDTEGQIQALWYQLSLGTSARDPSGLQSPPTKLVVSDQARTYRGRSQIAGFRGIAVGFPGGMNYAFNANNGALTGIWQGEFVTANWRSQGAGDFSPIGRPVTLAQDVAFLQMTDDQEKWPLQPVTTKQEPVNPDPLYPKNHGYAFAGYYFDDANVPTFMYRCGGISIEDKTIPNIADGASSLRRTFSFSTPAKSTVYFRALTGKIQSDSKTAFKTSDLQIKIASGETILRPSADGQELLIKLVLPQGKSTYTVDYSLRR